MITCIGIVHLGLEQGDGVMGSDGFLFRLSLYIVNFHIMLLSSLCYFGPSEVSVLPLGYCNRTEWPLYGYFFSLYLSFF